MSVETKTFLQSLLDSLSEEVGAVIETLPTVEVQDGSFKPEDIPSPESDKWVKLPEVVAVVCDLKGSTHLGTGRHDTSTARIYKSSVEGAVRIFHDFEADFIDIQGDGGFGLFWGERAHERALCAGVTIRTFSEDLVEQLETKWKGLPETGYKVGMHAARTLVKRVGTKRNVAEQEAVWAGKPVNFAAKCAQSAERHQLVATQTVWDRLMKNDYIAFSCGCNGTPAATLWADKTVETLPQDEQAVVVLDAPWCDNCGPEFCDAIMEGKTRRDDVTDSIRNSLNRMKMATALEAKRERDRQRSTHLRGIR
jgi:class 3 adenylate cyclase